MRNPSSPLRRAVAVCLSLLILPWQQPLLAMAEPPAPGAAANPREKLDALDVRLAALSARIKSDELKEADAAASLPAELVKVKDEYHAAQDGYVEAQKTAADKAPLKPLLAASTGQLLADAMVLRDLGGIRKDLTALLVQEALLSRRPDEIPAADWPAIEKAAPGFKASLGPLSSRVEKARNQAKLVPAEVEEGYRPLIAALDASFQNLRGRASKLDLDGLLAAKPQTASGDAAGALMAEVEKAIGPEKAALLKPQLAAVNTKLAGYLRSGNPADLTAAVGEIDRLYDAANIKDKDKKAALFKQLGDAAQALPAPQAVVPGAGPAVSVLTSTGIKKGSDLQSMKALDAVHFEHDEPAVAASTAAADWVTGGLAAATALKDQLVTALPGTAAFVADKSKAFAGALLGRSEALKGEIVADKIAADAAAKELAASYARIETLVAGLVLNAPDRTLDPPPAAAAKKPAYDQKWKKLNAKLAADWKTVQAEIGVKKVSKLGATGKGVWGWSVAVSSAAPAIVSADDLKALEPARARAESLVKLLDAMSAQTAAGTLDITLWNEDFRRRILYADGKASTASLGEFGRAFIGRTNAEKAASDKGAEVMSRFNAKFGGLKLTGDMAADRVELDKFFDDAENAKLIAEGAQLPPAVAAWYAARKFDRDNEKLPADKKMPRPETLPSQAEAYGRLVMTERADEVHKLKQGTKKAVGELYMAQYELNRTAYLTLCPDNGELAAATGPKGAEAAPLGGPDVVAQDPPKPEELSTAARDSFCKGFLKVARVPEAVTTSAYDQQRVLSDKLRPYLLALPLARATDKAAKSTDRMTSALRALSPEAKAELKAKGVDVDGILRQAEQGQITQWATAVYELGITSGTAGWRAFRDDVIQKYYGDHADLATAAQSRELREAVDAGDAARIGAVLTGIESPSTITSGFVLAVPRMLKSPRALQSARDRQILRAWNGGEEGPPAEASIAGQLLAAVAEMKAELGKPEASLPDNKAAVDEMRRVVALIEAAVADPSDPERLTEALRAARFTVWDGRAARVGLDTTKVPAQPKTDEERRDLQAALMLARLFKVSEQEMRTPAGAAKIRDGMAAKLKEVADAHEQNRRDQLLLSSHDEYRDRVLKLGAAAKGLLGPDDAGLVDAAAKGDKAAAAEIARRSRASASFRELAGLAGAVKSYKDDTDAVTKLTYEFSRTASGRAALGLPAAFAAAKSQTMSALYGAGPDGLTVSGWMVGIPAGTVTRRRNYETAGVENSPPPLPKDHQDVVGTAGKPVAPKGPPKSAKRDGITYVQGDGSVVFRSLNGDYSETRSQKYEKVTLGGAEVNAKVTMGFNADGERVQIYNDGKNSFVLKSKGDYDNDGKAVTIVTREPAANITKVAPVQTIQITSTEDGRQAVSLIERRGEGPGSETLNWTRFYTPTKKGAAYDSISMDLVGHSQSVTIGNLRTTFDLTKDNARLDDSFRRSTYDLSSGKAALVETKYYAIGKDAEGNRTVKAVVERPRTDLSKPGEATVVEIRDYRLKADDGDDTKRDPWGKPVYKNSINDLSGDQLARAIVDNQLVRDDRGDPRVDFRVTLNREGKTRAELAASYRRIGGGIASEMGLNKGDEDKTSLSGEFSTRFERLAKFFDNQFVVADGAYSVTANISRGGGVSMSGMKFDGAKMHDVSVDSPQYSFIALPKDAPKRQPGLPDKEQNGNFFAQELWAVRQASNDEYGFVTIEPGKDGKADRVTGYFGAYQGVEKHHAFRMDAYDENRTDGTGHFYSAADIVRPYYIDGSINPAGKAVADETTSMWNAGSKLGSYVNNKIRYSDWGRRNPRLAALAGGIAGGFIMTMLDPTMLLMMVVPMGAGYLAAKIGPMVLKAFKLIESGVNAYFMAQLVVHTGEGAVKVVVGFVKNDVNMINEGGMALGSAVAVGAQMGVMHALGPKNAGAEPGKDVVSREGPIEPTRGGAEPNSKAAAEPAKTNAEPAKTNSEPAKTNAEPAKTNSEPAKTNSEPAKTNAEPVKTNVEPVKPNTEPVRMKSEPVRGGETPPPPPARGFLPRIAEALGFGRSNLESPSAGGMGGGRGGGELTPGGTKISSNEGAGGGSSGGGAKALESGSAKPVENAGAKTGETGEARTPDAKVADAKVPDAKTSENAGSKNPAKDHPAELPLDPAGDARMAKNGARTAEPRVADAAPARNGGADAAELLGVGGGAGGGKGRAMIERGPVEGPVEGAPKTEAAGGKKGGAEKGGEGGESGARGKTKAKDASVDPSELAEGKDKPLDGAGDKGAAKGSDARGPETRTPDAKPGAEAREGSSERGREPVKDAKVADASNRAENGDAQREANSLVDDATGASPAPKAKPGLVRRALAGADAAVGVAMKPVAALVDVGAAVAGRIGRMKLPIIKVEIGSIFGVGIRGIQTVGLGVEAIGARLGFLGKPIRDIGMMLQGRVLAHEGRPLTFEEVWHPDLAERPSFLKAAKPEVIAEGGMVEGRFDPKTGRATFGPKAKGEVEIAVEVRPDGKGGVEIVDYRVKTADPKLAAKAHTEMYGQLERTFHTEQHQAALDDFFASKAVRERLAENLKQTGETFVDATYDPSSRRFRLAKPGKGELRLRLEPDAAGELRVTEANALAEGGRVPPSADYNLRLFSARRGVRVSEGLAAAPETDPAALGVKLAERMKADRVRVEAENVLRTEAAESRVADAKAKLGGAEGGLAGNAKVRASARKVAELRIERETAELEVAAADKHLKSLKLSKKTLARAEEALAAREKAGRELDAAATEYETALKALEAFPEGRAGRAEAQKRLSEAQARGRAAAERFKIADENAVIRGGELPGSAVDALVRRQAANGKIASIEASGKAALSELRDAARAARGEKGSLRETFALERVAAAEAALAKESVIREYRRDGLDRSTGGDGRRLAMLRLLGKERGVEAGRAGVGQAAGQNLCVLATAADMAAIKLGKPVEGALAEAEAAIIEHHQAKAKARGVADWEAAGRSEGEAFLRDAARTGMSAPEMLEMMTAVAEASGLRLVEIPAEKLFVELAAGKQVAVVMTHVADPITGFKGGAHMVNLSNWRLARNPATGVMETLVDVADPNVRVLTGYDGAGAPVYAARTVTTPLSEILPDIRGSLHGEHGRAAGYAFEPGTSAPRGPPAAKTPLLAGGEGVGSAVDLAANKKLLLADAAHYGRATMTDPPAEWTSSDHGRPRVELVKVVGTEGGSGLVYEGRLGGEVVAVKVFTEHPVTGPKEWPERLQYIRNEIASYRTMQDALPDGWVPKMHGEVEVGGNPSFATELVIGKDPTSLTVAEARLISPEAINQAAEAVDYLARKKLGGTDSPQPMILTVDQVINGVPRKAGDIIFMDAGALTADAHYWMKSADLAYDVAKAREMALRAEPGQEHLKVEDLYGKMSAKSKAEASAAAKAAAELAAARSSVLNLPEGVGSAPDVARYHRYFSAAEIHAAHPAPEGGRVYHDWQHTVKVADMAGEFAKARGLSAADAKFVSEVALLHDFDPTRAPGMPARALKTLEALRLDFAGTTSLTGEPGKSVLKERFKWTEAQLHMAEAMIQRTEFPFAEKHPNPAYTDKGPLARYEEMLAKMEPGDRRFVLREGALLSEYADKSSWYATEDFAGAFKVVEGLASEINRSVGKDVMSVDKLGTNGFLSVIGEPASFVHDAALAKKFGIELKLPNRAEAFALLPESYGRVFEANLKGFGEFDAAVKAGDAKAFERGRAAADAALKPQPHKEGVGAADNFFDGPSNPPARMPTDRPSPLRQMKTSLEARGKGEIMKEAEAILYTDGLTGLPNRAFIMAKAETLLKDVKDPTVAMLDMNNFGAVNAGLADLHGPVTGKEMGDGMLASAGPRIEAIAKGLGVHVARLGGEEIVVFGSVDGVIDFAAAMRKAFPPEKVLRDAHIAPGAPEQAAIDAAMTRMKRSGPVGDFTYGIARTEGRSFDVALKAADHVLGKAKSEGLRGEAVLETPGSSGVSFTRLREISALAQKVATLDHGPAKTRPSRVAEIEALKSKLTEKEYEVFLDAVFKDPLTLTKTAEWIDMARPQWEAKYEGKGELAMVSARNFKAVNDVLGHDAGDLYLKRLGVIARMEVMRLRKMGLDVEDPVRVGGKEFLIVGKDAAKAAELVSKRFTEKLLSGLVLSPEQFKVLRAKAPELGFIPKARAGNIGTLRAVHEPFKGGFKQAYERLILKLETVKVSEETAPVRHEAVGSASDDDVPSFLRRKWTAAVEKVAPKAADKVPPPPVEKAAPVPDGEYRNVAFSNKGKVKEHNANRGGELDIVVVDANGGRFIEEKDGTNLAAGGKLRRMLSRPQSAESWAREQIYDKTVERIKGLSAAQATFPHEGGGRPVPSTEQLKRIRTLEFRVKATNDGIVAAVNKEIERLEVKYPHWRFYVKFGEQ